MTRSSLAPNLAILVVEPLLSPKFIDLELTSRLPPSCGELSLTKSEFMPVKLDPSPVNEVAATVPVTVTPVLLV